VILHVRFTARGSQAREAAARAARSAALPGVPAVRVPKNTPVPDQNENGRILFLMRSEFPDAWAAFTSPAGPGPSELRLRLDVERFPRRVRRGRILLRNLELGFVLAPEAQHPAGGVQVTAEAPGLAGTQATTTRDPVLPVATVAFTLPQGGAVDAGDVVFRVDAQSLPVELASTDLVLLVHYAWTPPQN
jgi:hypothetical protein